MTIRHLLLFPLFPFVYVFIRKREAFLEILKLFKGFLTKCKPVVSGQIN